MKDSQSDSAFVLGGAGRRNSTGIDCEWVQPGGGIQSDTDNLTAAPETKNTQVNFANDLKNAVAEIAELSTTIPKKVISLLADAKEIKLVMSGGFYPPQPMHLLGLTGVQLALEKALKDNSQTYFTQTISNVVIPYGRYYLRYKNRDPEYSRGLLYFSMRESIIYALSKSLSSLKIDGLALCMLKEISVNNLIARLEGQKLEAMALDSVQQSISALAEVS